MEILRIDWEVYSKIKAEHFVLFGEGGLNEKPGTS